VANYCNITTDLNDVFDRIEDYNQRTRLRQQFEQHSGNVYKQPGTGHVYGLFEDSVNMTEVSTSGDIDAAGKWAYDDTNDILYFRASDDVDPDTHVIEGTIDWKTFKTRMRDEAMAELDSMLDARFPRPLPESRGYHTTDNYDVDIKKSCALLTCARIVGRVAGDMKLAKKLMDQVTNDEGTGIVDLHNDGRRVFSWEVSPDELGHFEIEADSTNTGDGFIELKGLYDGLVDEIWQVEIDTAGATKTATYKFSRDNGATYEFTLKTTDDEWKSLASGISIRFQQRSGTFDDGDKWVVRVISESAREDIVSPTVRLERA
jgi:hypothetical protein